MAQTRLSMRKIKETLRLKFECGLSKRQIARSIRASHSTVSDYLNRARQAGVVWPLSPDIDEDQLEGLLFPKTSELHLSSKPLPDFVEFHKELKKKGVTLFLLWEEYREKYPQGYGYTRITELYSKFKKEQEFCLRQDYRGGDKLFVDYAGPTIPIQNPNTGEIKQAQIFVACLGASNYTYSEATWGQSLPDWISSHVHAYEYFRGIPQATIPDNLRSGVKRACFYDPDINPTYQEMAQHYGTAIVPARPGKARDKAKVESGVLVVERWIFASLRKHTFFSLEELNRFIGQLLEKLNHRTFKKMPGCRADLYQKIDLPALKPLPEKPYEYGEWKFSRVNIDYHIEVEKNYYSVPYIYLHKKLEVRLTARTVEIFLKGKRIASHMRSYQERKYTTVEEHRPKKHREYLNWNPQRIISWGEKIGPYCKEYLNAILMNRKYPEQGYRACLGVLRLSKSFSNEKLEETCKRALELKVYSYKIIDSILKRNRNKTFQPNQNSDPLCQQKHENIRGQKYYP